MTLDMPHVQAILNGGCALPLGYLVSQHLFEKDCGFADFFAKRFARQRCVRVWKMRQEPEHGSEASVSCVWFPAALGHMFYVRCHQVVWFSSHVSFIDMCLLRFHEGIQPCNCSGREALFLLVDPKKINEPLDFCFPCSAMTITIARCDGLSLWFLLQFQWPHSQFANLEPGEIELTK